MSLNCLACASLPVGIFGRGRYAFYLSHVSGWVCLPSTTMQSTRLRTTRRRVHTKTTYIHTNSHSLVRRALLAAIGGVACISSICSADSAPRTSLSIALEWVQVQVQVMQPASQRLQPPVDLPRGKTAAKFRHALARQPNEECADDDDDTDDDCSVKCTPLWPHN